MSSGAAPRKVSRRKWLMPVGIALNAIAGALIALPVSFGGLGIQRLQPMVTEPICKEGNKDNKDRGKGIKDGQAATRDLKRCLRSREFLRVVTGDVLHLSPAR